MFKLDPKISLLRKTDIFYHAEFHQFIEAMGAPNIKYVDVMGAPVYDDAVVNMMYASFLFRASIETEKMAQAQKKFLRWVQDGCVIIIGLTLAISLVNGWI